MDTIIIWLAILAIAAVPLSIMYFLTHFSFKTRTWVTPTMTFTQSLQSPKHMGYAFFMVAFWIWLWHSELWVWYGGLTLLGYYLIVISKYDKENESTH